MRGWERLDDESDKAWEGFRTYRDLGPGRTLRAVAEALYGNRWRYGKRTVEKWSSRFDWVDRARALDDRDEMIRRQAVEEALRDKAGNLAARRAALEERLLAVSEKAAEQALYMLEWPLTEQRVVQEDEDGSPATYVFMPARWSKSTARQMVDIARAAVGNRSEEPQEPEEYDFSELTSEELDQLTELHSKLRPLPREEE